jgi:hypothetical protein
MNREMLLHASVAPLEKADELLGAMAWLSPMKSSQLGRKRLGGSAKLRRTAA